MRAVSHLPVKLFFSCLLAVAMIATLNPLPLRAAESGLSATIASSNQDDTAVRKSEAASGHLKISGTAADGSDVTAAELVALDADGNRVDAQNLAGQGILNNKIPNNGDYLRNDGGTITGDITLTCVFGSKEIGCPNDPRVAVRDIRLDLTVGGVSASSNLYRVDYSRPIIDGYEAIAPDRIKVTFSEPVRTNATLLTEPNQWSVESDSNGVARTVTAVAAGSANDCTYDADEDARAGSSGCTRILTVAGPALGEDETPRVSLATGLLSAGTEAYEDFASNQVLLSTDLNADNKATSDALDRIRPAAPNIETVAGKTPNSDDEVISTSATPKVVLTNLTEGHTVALSFTRNGTTTTMDAVEVPAGANSLELTPTLPADGTYDLSAVATDGAGNTSNDAGTPPRADGNSSVSYVLDTIAPKIKSAHFVDRRTVDVTFTEPVLPANDAGQWMIGDDPVEATGAGETRRLTAQVDTTSGAGVSWSPTGGSYSDRAENTLAAVKGFPLTDLPAVPAPTITAPARELATTASTVTIAGTAPSGNQYLVAQLFERNGETPLMEASAADGTWKFEHTVPAEQRTRLQVRLRDTKTFVTSPRADVADIVHDTKAPVVDVLLPAGPDLLGDPEQLGVGDTVTITWTASDEAKGDVQDPDHSRAADIFVVADGVETRIAHGIVAQPGTEQKFIYTLKSGDLDGKRVRDLSFRVDVADDAGNIGNDTSGTIRLLVSTTVAAPAVTTPAQEVFTSGSGVTISGTSPADSETNKYLDAQLFEGDGDTLLATTSVAGDTWTFDHKPAADQRNELQVRLRDRDTGITSPLVSVPDIVHDTKAPVVDVRLPASADILGRPQEFGVGDVVTITWVATDEANDAERPDHSKTASVFKVAGSRSTAIKTGIVAQPGQEQTVTYTLTESDLGGQGLRDLTFRVDVTDQANNTGGDVSATIRLLGDRVGYTPVLTAPDTIEVRFTEQMQGLSGPTDWTVDGQPVPAEVPVDRNGTTVVVLHTPLETDPNATPAVQFTPTLPATQRLRSMNDSQITLASRTAIDRTLPALTVKRPDTPDIMDADRIRFTGTTDVTGRPNTIAAYYADAAGNPRGSAVASAAAAKDGAWQLRVPLVANRLNRIVFRAVDPSNNRSAVAPVPHFSVIEDSRRPVVTSLTPRSGVSVGPKTTIRWTTSEANRNFVRLQYRLGSAASWTTIASETPDDGSYRWNTPRTLRGKVFLLRATSFDQAGKRGALTSTGLRADFVRPKMRLARTIAPNKVRVVFTETVRSARPAGFTVDGRAVRRMRGSGRVRTLVLHYSMKRTTPIVAYDGRTTTDRVGNAMRAGQAQARRAFAFPVTDFDARRTSARSVRLTWDDDRNLRADMRGYRIFRDGRRIARVDSAVRSFRDRVTGSHRYAIRAIDDRGRGSYFRGDRVR